MTDGRLQAWLWPHAGIAAALAIAVGGALLVAVGVHRRCGRRLPSG